MKKTGQLEQKLDTFLEIDHKPLGIKGEDACAYDFSRPDLHSQGVFDGCGGAGSWKYEEFMNASGALVAANSIAGKYLDWFSRQTAETCADEKALSESFSREAWELLNNLKQSCAPMGISGSLVKSFPCTASIAVMQPAANGGIDLTVLNDGDSRVYLFTAERGLVQLTDDDSRGHPDPLQSLRESAALSDMLNADKQFRIKVLRLNAPLPCAVLCATDGVFGYLRSPMDFEHLFLQAIGHSVNFAQFEERLRDGIVRVTGDDSTCIASFYGWGGFPQLKVRTEARRRQVADLIRRIDSADDQERALHEVWESYRKQTVYSEMQV